MCVLSQSKPQRRRTLDLGGVLKKARREERRGAPRGVYGVQNCDCEVVGSHLGLQAAPKAAISCTSYAPQAPEK